MALEEKCGIAGVYLKKPLNQHPKGAASYYLYVMLNLLQHRGQLSCGIATKKNGKLKAYNGMGLVNEVFNTSDPEKFYKILAKTESYVGIGHVRYSTSGDDKSHRAIQNGIMPFVSNYGQDQFSFSFNGNIFNHDLIKNQLKEKGIELEDIDSKSLEYKLKTVKRNGSFDSFFRRVFDKHINSSISFLYLDSKDNMVLFREGRRPLVYGENDYLFAAASEARALKKLGINYIKDIRPGSILIVNKDNLNSSKSQLSITSKTSGTCIFEPVYFSYVDNVIDGLSVNQFRKKQGKCLAKRLASFVTLDQTFPDKYSIIAVPNTSIPITEEMCSELTYMIIQNIVKKEGLPAVYNFMKKTRGKGVRRANALIVSGTKRSFIEPDRKNVLNTKYTVLNEEVEGKIAVLVDDSIVRGSTSKKIISQIRKEGNPKEVYFLSSFPPIKNPCFAGISFSTYDQLIASNFDTEEKIAKEIGADKIIYQRITDLLEATGMPNAYCTACLNGKYPYNIENKLSKKALNDFKRKSRK